MPDLRVIRPADANETAQAWRIAVDSEGPTALILSRQDLPVLAETVDRAAHGVPRGAYVLRDAEGGSPDLVLCRVGRDKARWEAAQAGHGMPGWEATLPSFAPGDGPI